MEYAKWRACERFNILPPDVKSSWDKMNVWQKAKVISYSQIRQYEEQDEKSDELKFLAGIKF